MSAPLPPIGNCLPACSESSISQIPGPPGKPGKPGLDGLNGIDAFTITTSGFTQPPPFNNVTVAVEDSAWAVVGQKVFVGGGGGYYDVFAVPDGVSIALTNLNYTGNAIPTVFINGGVGVSPGGVKGADGSVGSIALNNLSPTTTRGDIIADDGNGGGAASDVRMPVGTDGQVLAGDSSQSTGLRYSTITPNTATDKAIARFNGATGTPTALQNSLMTVADDGSIQSTGGNARGAHATDLQIIRTAADQVASGLDSGVLSGGSNKASGGMSVVTGGGFNTASGQDSSVVGGLQNTASGDQSFVGGGSLNQATNASSAVSAGSTNIASGVASTVGGGASNQATGDSATVSGGGSNVASGSQSFVGAGNVNQATGQRSAVAGGWNNLSTDTNAFVGGGGGNSASGSGACVLGGDVNVASGFDSSVAGGSRNTASGKYSSIIGGSFGLADKVGQVTHASGRFAASGDSQTSEMTLRISTADATPTELFLDGVSARAVVPLNTVWAFTVTVAGRSSAGVCAAWEVKGAIINNGGVVTLVSATSNSSLADGTGGTWGAIGNVAVNSDNVNKTLQIVCTGAAATNIRFSALLKVVEIGF